MLSEMNGILKGFTVTQIGFIVKDIDLAAEKFSKLTGMEVAARSDTADSDTGAWKYSGRPLGGGMRNLAFRFGNVEVEYIQPYPGDSAWNEYLETHGEGIHHIAFEVKDLYRVACELEKAGYQRVQEGEFEGGRFAYFDTVEDIKTSLELLEFDD